MPTAAQHLKRNHRQQLFEDAEHVRSATRLYLDRAAENGAYYDALIADYRPLLEHIHTSRRSPLEDAGVTKRRIDAKLLADIGDRVFSRAMADVVEQGSTAPRRRVRTQADRLRSCGTVMGYNQCPDQHRKLSICLCDMPKYCRRCARIDAYRKSEQLLAVTKKLLKRPITGYNLRFLTLTTLNTGNVVNDAQTAIQAWSKLWRSMFQADFSAAWRRLEVGPKDGMVHLHVLLYSPWVNQQDISAKWAELTGAKVVDIRAVDRNKHLAKAVQEVCKYVTDMDKWVERHGIDDGLAKVFAIGRALHGRRLTERYGSYRRRVFNDRMGFSMPELEELTPDRCDTCGKKWAAFIEVVEPRGPPKLKVISHSHALH